MNVNVFFPLKTKTINQKNIKSNNIFQKRVIQYFLEITFNFEKFK